MKKQTNYEKIVLWPGFHTVLICKVDLELSKPFDYRV